MGVKGGGEVDIVEYNDFIFSGSGFPFLGSGFTFLGFGFTLLGSKPTRIIKKLKLRISQKRKFSD